MANFVVNLKSLLKFDPKAQKIKVFRAAAVIWAMAVGFFSLLPSSHAVTSGLWDKLDHVIAFAILAGFIRIAWPVLAHSHVWLIATVYGGLIEFGQMLSPGRIADVMDGVANALGACLGLTLVWLWSRKKRSGSGD